MRDTKMSKQSVTPPAKEVGEHLHADLIPLRNKTIGGNTFILFAVDEKSGYCSGVPIPKKQTVNIVEAFRILLSEYSSSDHKVQRITTDDEEALSVAKRPFAELGVDLTPTPADFHAKRAERYLQALKGRKRAKELQWDYELPGKLEAELHLSVIRDMNATPSKCSFPHTPYQLVKHKRPTTPVYLFGDSHTHVTHVEKTPPLMANTSFLLDMAII
jgi:hypothetical protein